MMTLRITRRGVREEGAAVLAGQRFLPRDPQVDFVDQGRRVDQGHRRLARQCDVATTSSSE